MNTLETKLNHLRHIIKDYESILVCFSGGVDSTFLLKIAVDELGKQCHAINCVSDTVAQSEIEAAYQTGKEFHLDNRLHVIESNELDRPGFAENNPDRCAKCKTELMHHAKPLAKTLNIQTIALGTNLDDLGDYRPGIAVAKAHGAQEPLVTAQFTKADVRQASKDLGLRTWNKPQLACLSSRFPFGTEITKERLSQVDRFEDGLRQLGFTQIRVRFHDSIARLEFDEKDMSKALDPSIRPHIVTLGKQLGFAHIALDLAGFRSGSLSQASLVSLGLPSGQEKD